MNPWKRGKHEITKRLPNRIDTWVIRVVFRRIKIHLCLPNAATDELVRQVMFTGNLALHMAPRPLRPRFQHQETVRETLLNAAAMRPPQTYRLPPDTPLIDAKVRNAHLSVNQRSFEFSHERFA